MQLLLYTNGDAAEALEWLNELDRQYQPTSMMKYGMGDFIDELKENGYLQENPQDGFIHQAGNQKQTIRKSLEEISGKLKKNKIRATTRTLLKPGRQGDI